jgi:hypothetical protein
MMHGSWQITQEKDEKKKAVVKHLTVAANIQSPFEKVTLQILKVLP